MKSTFAIDIGNLTDVGCVRSNNQDYYGTYDTERGKLVVVCDGMGGYKGGEIASYIAVESFKKNFINIKQIHDPKAMFAVALENAHDAIVMEQKEDHDYEDMGTTLVALYLEEHKAWFANIGDSRLYLLRQGKLIQLTKDHSLVQKMVDNKIITPEQADYHPKKNVILRALGAKDSTPDISGPISVYKDDIFMLCSDGLYSYFSEKEIAEIMMKPVQKGCEEFVNTAKTRGGNDNITVQIARIAQGRRLRRPPLKKPRKKAIPLLVFLLAIIAIFFLIHQSRMINVPNLTGLSIDGAKAQLDSLGLVVNEIVKRPDIENIDKIISTTPPMGSRVKQGSKIDLTVGSRENRRVTVPVLKGESIVKAIEELNKLGLAIGQIDAREDSINVGKIVSTSPSSSKEIPEDSIVNIVIGISDPIQVPDLRGINKETAIKIIRSFGLSDSLVVEKNNEYIDRVIDMSRISDIVNRGSGIRLVIGVPDRIFTPYLIGLTLQKARAVLDSLDLEVGDKEEKQDPNSIDRIIDMWPEPGVEVNRKSKIDLVVGVNAT